MNAIKVECYAGYKGDQRPVRFFLNDRVLEVMDILRTEKAPIALVTNAQDPARRSKGRRRG